MKKAKSNKSGKSYAARVEGYDRKMGNKSNKPAKAPADIAQAIKRSKKASKKPKIKAQRMKGK